MRPSDQQSPAALSRSVFLVGFMGAGKTTVGKSLAARLGRRFVDLDDLVVEQSGKTVSEIFREDGEAEFRRLEKDCLKALVQSMAEPSVVALGGGAYVQAANIQELKAAGVPVVFLDGDAGVLMLRCQSGGGSRPLLQDENQFRQLYESRRGSYMKADFRVDTTDRTVEAVAGKITEYLSGLGIV